MTDWQITTVIADEWQSPTSRSLRLALSEPFDALPGQHIDIRLTAEDGYSTARTYSLSDVRETRTVEVTIEKMPDGEVSPYLVDVIEVGEPLEISGPNGGWFTWNAADSSPVQLIAGGSGIAPLMAMLRSREVLAPATEFGLVYSVRSPDQVYYATEFAQLSDHRRLDVYLAHTRIAPEGVNRPAVRLTAAELSSWSIPPERGPMVFICGPNGFVESCAAWMVQAGHSPNRIRTERFGGG